jgi:hypothetical protein
MQCLGALLSCLRPLYMVVTRVMCIAQLNNFNFNGFFRESKNLTGRERNNTINNNIFIKV